MAVSILVARALVESAAERGVAPEQLLSAAGFDPARMNHADGRMAIEEYDQLIEQALELTGDEALGLHFSERAQGGAHQLIAHLVEAAPTLRDGLETLFRFHRLVADQPIWRLEEQDHLARLIYDVTPGTPRGRRFRAEMTLIGWQHLVRYFRRGAPIYQAAFEHPAPSYCGEYTRLFDGVERFEQSFTGLVFDRALLSASQLNGDPELYRVLEVEAEARTARLGRKASFAERVRHCLLDAAKGRGQDFDMADVARTLGVSVRTLRRRLQEEGVTYSAVAGEAFADLAKRLLVDEERSVEETAYAMGFSAPTSFHKAFKRWTGTTPKAFRQRHERAAAE